ncbi:MAG: hypothetical protein MRY74_07875 [Neomegalonema sp.]|nr:hypothetical protein [Neomegalonema sp.]
MVKIVARCHPALKPVLPPPIPAAQGLPDWLRTMPSVAESATLGGASVRTLKHCPPLLDAFTSGLLLPLAADVTVGGGELSWDWAPPPTPDQLTTRAPIGLHAPEQAEGAPLPIGDRFVLKFMNFWTLESPPGWSILFTHPFNREELPFRTLTGIVECDSFKDGFVHFPALWTDPTFEGVLKAGTPVAQAIPFPRQDMELETATFDSAAAGRVREMQAALQEEPGHYRKLRKRKQQEDGLE